jgi:RNA polymerase subunit RPABC4/transcription elongation factor Spt4
MLSTASRRSGDVDSYLMLQHFPLSSAYLCQDCNSIGNNANQCPACASEVLMSLSAILNREDNEMAQPQYSNFPALAAVSSARAGSVLAA